MYKVIINRFIPFGGYKALAILPFVFVRKDVLFSVYDKNHECIHIEQQKEVMPFALVTAVIMSIYGCGWCSLLALALYFWLYAAEYMVRLVIYGFNMREAYRNISFEQEAYMNDKNMAYLDFRSQYAWIRYLNRKTYINK